ncbi:MAG TPA: hypothetical protein VNX68_16100, partial [Nitrosopumilaceae archaeon]|nr:hypothetical protein [Nitrosopumilaceae archaeon]
TLLHLFAHAIMDQGCVNSQSHDLRFMETLWKLVIEHYKNPKSYRWYGEHKTVMEFGMNRCRAWRMNRE